MYTYTYIHIYIRTYTYPVVLPITSPNSVAGGISSSAAAEHRLAAEWTAKLAAENRRKLQGGPLADFCLGKPRENGSSMGKPYENHTKTIGKP